MTEKDQLNAAQYAFTARISKGTNMKTKFPCSYFLSWKVKDQIGTKEVSSEKHQSVDENGDVIFDT